MTIGDQLQTASFAGVPFLLPRESEVGGRKAAIHEYPNSDLRFVEDLGRLQPTFSVIALIHGQNVVQERQRLTAALAAGEGALVHPYLGRRQCFPVRYDIRTSDAALGEVIFDIEFVQTDLAAGLFGVASGIQGVFEAADKARSSLDKAMNGRYSPVAAKNSIKRIGTRIRQQLSVVQSTVASVVNPVQDGLNEFTKQVGLVRGDVLSIARTPQLITSGLRGVFDSFQSIALLPSDLRREFSLLTNFGSLPRFLPNGQLSISTGSVRSPISRTTKVRIIEDDNLRVLDQYLRIEALIGSFEAEASADFETDVELNLTRARLADDFDRIIQNQDDVIDSSTLGDEVLTDENVTVASAVVSEAEAFANGIGFDSELKANLEDLRVAALAVLTDDVKSPFRVDTFALGLVDAQIATHQLYGDQDLVESIAALNGGQNSSLYRLPVKGLIG